MNLRVLLTTTSRKPLKMKLKRWFSLLNVRVDHLSFVCVQPFNDAGVLQLPLDLSPLATPIIRNKEPAATETHRDSPLPHPESTTNDDKVYALHKCLWYVI